MCTVDTIVRDFLVEAQQDFIGMWAVVGTVRDDLKLTDNAEVKARTLDVVRGLLDHGLWPGDFDYGKSKIYLWTDPDAASCLARIDKEWDPAKGDPMWPDSICWFHWKKN